MLQAAGADTNAFATASPEKAVSGQDSKKDGEGSEEKSAGSLSVTPKTIDKTLVAGPLIAATTDKSEGGRHRLLRSGLSGYRGRKVFNFGPPRFDGGGTVLNE